MSEKTQKKRQSEGASLPSSPSPSKKGKTQSLTSPLTTPSKSTPWKSSNTEGIELLNGFTNFCDKNIGNIDPKFKTKKDLESIWKSKPCWYRFKYNTFRQNYTRNGDKFIADRQKRGGRGTIYSFF